MFRFASIDQPTALPRVVAALGSSYWFQTDDAHVIASNEVVEALDLDDDPRRWWKKICAKMKSPPRVECSVCGKSEPVGAVDVQPLDDEIDGAIDLLVLGHSHRVDEPAEGRVVYVVRGIHNPEADQQADQPKEVDDLPPRRLPDRDDGELPGLGPHRVDSYLTTLSHDLRTPLDAIIGYSELLMESDDPSSEASQRSVERIHESGRTLLDTVSELERQIVRERHKRRLAETLGSLSRMMASSLEFDEVIEKVHECIAQVINFDRSQILLLRDERLHVILDRCRGSWSVPERAARNISLSGYPHGDLLESAPEPLAIGQIDFTRRGAAAAVHPECQSWLGVALVSAGEPVAMICLESKVADFYDDFDVDLMTALSHHAALAMTNAQEFLQIRKRARVDPLTGVYTRGYFFECCDKQLADAVNSDRDLGLIMLDIDHFKPINDTYGHTRGDEVLRGVATEIRSSLRDGDLVGRYGGEEFTILLPGATLEVAGRVAERIRRGIEEFDFEIDGRQLGVTVSAGVVALGEQRECTIEEMVDGADKALYRAKDDGRNRVVVDGD